MFVLFSCYLLPSPLADPLSFNSSFLHPRPPSTPGIRTEQDFYVRLIDSMTKQVSFLISCHRVTLRLSGSWLLHSRGTGIWTLKAGADDRPHSSESIEALPLPLPPPAQRRAARLLSSKGVSGLGNEDNGVLSTEKKG